MDAFVDREDATEQEDHDGDDERPEVGLHAEPERMVLRGLPFRASHPEEQQALVRGIRDAVHRLGDHARAPGERTRDELARGDEPIASHRREHDLLRVSSHGEVIGRRASRASGHACCVA